MNVLNNGEVTIKWIEKILYIDLDQFPELKYNILDKQKRKRNQEKIEELFAQNKIDQFQRKNLNTIAEGLSKELILKNMQSNYERKIPYTLQNNKVVTENNIEELFNSNT